MKNLVYLIIFCLVIKSNAQGLYEEIELSNGSTFLLGEITTDHLQSNSYSNWYTVNYENYTVDKKLVQLFKKQLNQHEVVLFLGTWCGDSKREVPRMIKILEAADFPQEKLKIIALDRRKENYKKGLHGEEEGWNIIRVPTLILLKNGIEVNRIVERPIDTLEEDFLTILTNSDYTPNYAD